MIVIILTLILLAIVALVEASVVYSMNKRLRLLELLLLSCNLEISLHRIETFPIEKEGKG